MTYTLLAGSRFKIFALPLPKNASNDRFNSFFLQMMLGATELLSDDGMALLIKARP